MSTDPASGDRTAPETVDSPSLVESRAHLGPEELAAGSADPMAQAAAILEESEERVNDDGTHPGDHEHRRSAEITDPVN